MNQIFASTLYKASKNKEHIKSALANPKNGELVQQLREYLDDDTLDQLTEESTDTENLADNSADIDDVTIPEVTEDSGDSGAKVVRTPTAKFTSKEDHLDDLKDFESDMDAESVQQPSEASAEPESADSEATAESVESAVKVEDAEKAIDTNSIQGSLNSREDTAGVSYILIKDNELWIHYKDDINLNNVMENVIKWFRDTCYTNLTFNRLARAANAIVFEIVDSNINNYSMSKEDEA